MGYWETVDALHTLDLGRQVLVGDILPTFVGPAAVRARMDEINARYQSLADAFQRSKASEELGSSWTRLKAAWDGFVKDHRDSWWSLAMNAKALSEEMDKYDENYKGMYEALGKELAAQGQAAPSAIAPPSPNPNSSAGQAPSNPGLGSLKSSPIAMGVVTVAGLFAAGCLIKAVKS